MGSTVHYTASAPTATVKAIAAFQTGPTAQEPFPAIAYTVVVDLARANLCHTLQTRVWHSGAPGANTSRLSICYVGDDMPTNRQLEDMAQAHVWFEHELGRVLTIQGHGDDYQTACPGPNRGRWWPLLLVRIAAVRRGG